MAKLAAQTPTLVSQAQYEYNGAQQTENPTENKRDGECQWNGRPNRGDKEIQIDEARVAARKNQHCCEYENNEDSDADFLQQAFTPTRSDARRPTGRNQRQCIA